MYTFAVSQGAALPIPPLKIRDGNGNVITSYSGTETFVTQIWPGGNRAAAFSAPTSWIDHTAGTFNLSITTAETTGLSLGRYEILTRLTAGSADPVDVFRATLDVLPAPGTETPPTTYCQLSDLLKYGRSWLRQLQTTDDEAGFAEQLGRARSWIEDLAHAHYRVAGMTMVVGSQAFGPRRSGARSSWLEQELAANTLMVTDQIREMAAHKALELICKSQIGMGDRSQDYAGLARMFRSHAEYLATCSTLSLDTNGDGFPDVNIDLSCTDPMDA